jgi:hypothetical protein
LTTQELWQLTFIHCSAWRTASRCRATVAGSTKSSAKSSMPPRLLVAASVIGAERMGSASWISGERTTTSRAGSGSVAASSPPGFRGGSSGGHLHRLEGSSGSLLSLWCQVLHGHRRQDLVPSGLGTCRQKDKCISQHATTTTLESSSTSAEYSPSTMLDTGSVASGTGALGSA